MEFSKTVSGNGITQPRAIPVPKIGEIGGGHFRLFWCKFAKSRRVRNFEPNFLENWRTDVFYFFMWFDDDLKIVDQNGVPMQQHVSFGISQK